ncbi:PPOX class F420-dependent oxidoreductase [Microbispora rosea subsp. aerata]|nr:TIGR03668 family PPOX class F420-dependent oxidoreductase [Microbispora rosea]GGO29697.1 PPOX class F420-dependent oxidoreductase [Microbispora rosea subsp. aerata]GIH58944.1 PPOX class F420-dependent oxidoreductase [Microbispora rosea subsp. aerata]GLJ86188.1 PPOX class F420-dependent oxidoreductase [Microbispora rosea subsp. aerata]
MPEERARELFAAARVARLATIGAGGAPRLVPVTFALIHGTAPGAEDIGPPDAGREGGRLGGGPRVDRVTDAGHEGGGPGGGPRVDRGGGLGVVVTAVDHKPKATTDLRRLRDIRDNPRVCLLADHYEDDWERLWWVRADGRARIVEGGDERARAVAWLVRKYAQYRERPPAGPAIVIHVERWSGWSYAGI